MAKKPTYVELEKKVTKLEKGTLALKESNELLLEKDAELIGFLNALTETAILVDHQKLTFISCNKVAAQRLGKSVEEIIGMSLFDVMPYDAAEIRKMYSEKVVATGEPGRFVSDREGRMYDISIYPVFDNLGKVDRLAVYSQDMTDRIQAEEALKDSEERYRNLVNLSPDAIAVIQESRFKLINTEFTKLFGYTQHDIDKGLGTLEIVRDQDKKMIGERMNKRLAGKKVSPKKLSTHTVARNGKIIPCETSDARIQYDGRPAILIIIRDITEREQAELALKEREEELRTKAQDLQEVNAALKVLLKHREEDKAEIEERVLSNIRELVIPFLEKLKSGAIDTKQKSYANIVESNLEDIISPFSHRLSVKHLKLTPAEIQISNLIKQGKTTKEIANLLNLSDRTIETHRKNIRRKIGIRNKSENLRTHLMNIYNG
ncbi:MAG: PAS domain S-box protein [Deltaproteobacteria bacterium]|nr:PAS domain S-box protein [Deltaproteobacteria bacterium]